MDGSRFDAVIRSHANHSRRSLLVALVAPAAGTLSLTSLLPAQAKKRKRRKRKKPALPPPPPESPPPEPAPGPPHGRVICPPNSATPSCPATDPVCCPLTSAINGLCCRNGEQCCGPGLNGEARCCPTSYQCCPGRTDTSDGYPVCCMHGCCQGPEGCSENQQCSDSGCCYFACPNNTEVCFNGCCAEGFVCVTSSDGENRQCCAAADACPGSRTGCCGGLTCTVIENPQPGGPTHACVA